MMMEELFKKYNVVHINGYRYYLVNLRERSFDLENTIPYCITIDGVTIVDSSWKNLIPKIVEELDSKSPKTIEELLSIKCDWSKQCVFGTVRKSNYTPYKGIYINTNHTAIHAMWTIQLLLKEYNVDLDKCEFIIKRQPIAEPKEIREAVAEQCKKGFEDYLRSELNKNDKSIKAIINNIECLNRQFLPRISSGYTDFYLIENPAFFWNYSKKTEEYFARKGCSSEVLYKLSRQLNYLYEYIKKVNKENKIKYSNYFYGSKNDTSLDEFLDDFDSSLD